MGRTGLGITALLSGLLGGMGEARERRQNEEYKKALVDQIKTKAKLEEQDLNLKLMKMQQDQAIDQYFMGGGQGPIPQINQQVISGMPMPGGASVPGITEVMPPGMGGAQPQPQQRQGLIPMIGRLLSGQSMRPQQNQLNSLNTKFNEDINYAAQRHGVDPNLIASVITHESQFNPQATSPAGAMGLMQLMPETAKMMGVSDPYNPRQNILAGTQYLKSLIEQFGGDVPKAIAAYNAGPGRVAQGGQLPKETQIFVPKVMQTYQNVAANTQQAQSQGVGYQYGGKKSDSGGIDCSGWVCEQMQKMGYNVQDSAAGLAETAYKKDALGYVTPDKMQPGMLLFKTSDTAKKEGRFGNIGHVGITVQKGNQLYVSESTTGGPQLTPVSKYVGNLGGVYAAPLGVYGQPQQDQSQIPSSQTQGGNKIDWSNPFVQMLAKKRYGWVPEQKGMLKVDVGDAIELRDALTGQVKERIPKTPDTLMQPYSDPYGNKFVQPMTKPGLNNPSQPVGTPYQIEPGPMKSAIPMTAKDREDIEDFRGSLSELESLSQFANMPHVFGPGNDILMDLLTNKGLTSKAAQAYAGPKEDLVAFRSALERFNSTIRKEKYGGALTDTEAKNYQREALNARNPQEFMVVLNKMSNSIQKKLQNKLDMLQGTQGDYLSAVREESKSKGKSQTKKLKFNPQTGMVE